MSLGGVKKGQNGNTLCTKLHLEAKTLPEGAILGAFAVIE